MAEDRLARSSTFSTVSSATSSAGNSFRTSWSGPSFSYTFHGKAKKISSGSYRIYQAIFERACSEPYYILNDAAIDVVKLSELPDTELRDLWHDALEATFHPSLSGGSREGFLNRDEFFILLASLQARLQMTDDMFRLRFAPHLEPDTGRPSPSTTYSFTIGLDESREIPRMPDSQHSKSPISRKPLPRGRLTNARSIAESIGSDYIQGNTPDYEETYADGFTEYHSPTFQNRLPSLDDTVSGKQSHGDSSFWACPKCTFRNSLHSPTCGVCEFRRNLDPYSDKISTSVIQAGRATTPTSPGRQQNPFQEPMSGMDSKEAVRFSLPTLPEVVLPTLPEVMPPTLPEVVPEIKAGLEPVETARELIMPIRNPAARPSLRVSDAQIVTRESDAQALALIKALEPPQVQKPQPREASLSIKRFSRSILSGSKKSEKSEPPQADPDKASSGFSLGGLAKLLGDAAEAGDLSLVASILKLGADVNYSSRKKEACHYAATRAITSNNDHIVEYLLLKGMNKKSAANALHKAIIKGNCLDIAMKLIPHADFNCMWAVKGEAEKTEESCLGALSRMNDDGNRDRLRLLRLMIEQSSFDADKPAMILESASEKVALSILGCFTQQIGLSAVEPLLLQLGETYKVPRQQRYGSPYIHVDPIACISIKYWQREPKLAVELAHLLLKHGSRLTGVEEKYTPLVSALAAGCVSGVRLFLDKGADPECVMTTVGWSTPLPPLSYAAQEPEISIDICHDLISKGARPRRSDEQGRTALYWACRGGNFHAIKYLFMLDMTNSNINKCLEAAIDSYNPQVAWELVNIGAYATAATWKHAMSSKPVGDRRNAYLEIIDILLSTKTQLQPELVLAAIDHQNFWGLSRILEVRNGILDFDKDAIFSNPRWSGIVCKANRSIGPRAKKYGWGTRRDLQSCVAYAEERNAHDIVGLLKSYDWESRAECEMDCGLKLWVEACESTPPHRVQNGYTMEMAGSKKTAI